jgi:hypothetical protein
MGGQLTAGAGGCSTGMIIEIKGLPLIAKGSVIAFRRPSRRVLVEFGVMSQVHLMFLA